MARKNRVWVPGATYHITARGNQKQEIFKDTKDYSFYMNLLTECKELIPFNLHAYCLMPNHLHLLLETIEHPPGEIIKWIHTRYAIRFNRKYDLVGHVFQGRYHSSFIYNQDYFLKASRYIHLNPVEAKLVMNPEDYRWSSYKTFLKDDDTSISGTGSLITIDKTLTYFPGTRREQHKQYINYIQEQSTETEPTTRTLTH